MRHPRRHRRFRVRSCSVYGLLRAVAHTHIHADRIPRSPQAGCLRAPGRGGARPGELVARPSSTPSGWATATWRRTSRRRWTGCSSPSTTGPSDRVTGRPGRIARMNHRDLATALIDGTEPIPLLEDLLGAWPDVRFNIDLKDAPAIGPLAAGAAPDRSLGPGLRDLVLGEPAARRTAGVRPAGVHGRVPIGTAVVRFGGPRAPRDRTRPGPGRGRPGQPERARAGLAGRGSGVWPAAGSRARGSSGPGRAAGPDGCAAAPRCRRRSPRPRSSAGRTPSACTCTPGRSTHPR